MEFRLDVTNEIDGRQWSFTSDNFDSIDKYEQRKQNHIKNKVFGLPERDYVYSSEYFENDVSISMNLNDLPPIYDDRVLEERTEEQTGSFERFIGEYDDDGNEIDPDNPDNYETVNTKVVRVIKRLKADYVLNEIDITEEVAEKEAKRQEIAQFKNELKNQDYGSVNSVAALKEVVQKLSDIVLGE